MRTAIIAITRGGAELARQLADRFPQARVLVPERLRDGHGFVGFDEPLSNLLPRLFSSQDALICIMATGIVVRLLAPHLQGKQVDPAVVVVDETGRFAISLLSGHLGGANALARAVAAALDGEAVITTATDRHDLPAWDTVAATAGLAVEPVGHIKVLNRQLLEGGAIALVDPQRRVCDLFEAVPGVACYETFMAAEEAGPECRVYVTHRLIEDLAERPSLLLLRPRDLMVGIGCNRSTPAEEIDAAVRIVMSRAQLAELSLAAVASIDDKRDEAGLQEFARRRGLPLKFFPAAELNRIDVPSPPSVHALQAVRAKGVCEPAALCAAGRGRLLVRKQKLGNVTVAIAEIVAGCRSGTDKPTAAAQVADEA